MTDLPFGVNKFGQAVLSNCTVDLLNIQSHHRLLKE